MMRHFCIQWRHLHSSATKFPALITQDYSITSQSETSQIEDIVHIFIREGHFRI